MTKCTTQLGPYKGYRGSIEESTEDKCFYGKVLFITDLVMYESETLNGLEKEFKETVDEYLNDCLAAGKTPEKACTGSINIRIGPELHTWYKILADRESRSVNDVIKEVLQDYHEDYTTRNEYEFSLEANGSEVIVIQPDEVLQ